jgi:hypothetical protein
MLLTPWCSQNRGSEGVGEGSDMSLNESYQSDARRTAHIYSPSDRQVNSVVHTLRARTLHSGKERIRIATEAVDHSLHHFVGDSRVGKELLVGVLKGEDQVLPERLGSPLAPDGVGNGVDAHSIVESAIRNMPVVLFLAPVYGVRRYAKNI